MIQNNNQDITFDEIIDNFSGLFFAGTDTTGNMVGSALYFLSRNPKIQKEAREEVMKVISAKNKNNLSTDELFNSITFEDISNMNLLNAILKESMRIIPPAASAFPRYALKDIKIGEFDIYKGDLVNTTFLYNQINSKEYPNSDVFDPYRWLS